MASRREEKPFNAITSSYGGVMGSADFTKKTFFCQIEGCEEICLEPKKNEAKQDKKCVERFPSLIPEASKERKKAAKVGRVGGGAALHLGFGQAPPSHLYAVNMFFVRCVAWPPLALNPSKKKNPLEGPCPFRAGPLWPAAIAIYPPGRRVVKNGAPHGWEKLARWLGIGSRQSGRPRKKLARAPPRANAKKIAIDIRAMGPIVTTLLYKGNGIFRSDAQATSLWGAKIQPKKPFNTAKRWKNAFKRGRFASPIPPASRRTRRGE